MNSKPAKSSRKNENIWIALEEKKKEVCLFGKMLH